MFFRRNKHVHGFTCFTAFFVVIDFITSHIFMVFNCDHLFFWDVQMIFRSTITMLSCLIDLLFGFLSRTNSLFDSIFHCNIDHLGLSFEMNLHYWFKQGRNLFNALPDSFFGTLIHNRLGECFSSILSI